MTRTATADHILACLPRDGDTIEPSQIQARTGLPRNTVHAALSRAVKRGLVVRVRVGAYARVGR